MTDDKTLASSPLHPAASDWSLLDAQLWQFLSHPLSRAKIDDADCTCRYLRANGAGGAQWMETEGAVQLSPPTDGEPLALLRWLLHGHHRDTAERLSTLRTACENAFRTFQSNYVTTAADSRTEPDQPSRLIVEREWALRFGILHKALLQETDLRALGALTPLTHSLPVACMASRPMSVAITLLTAIASKPGLGANAVENTNALKSWRAEIAKINDEQVAKKLRILQWEVMPRDLVAEKRGLIRYQVGTSIVEATGCVSGLFHSDLAVSAWQDHSTGLVPYVIPESTTSLPATPAANLKLSRTAFRKTLGRAHDLNAYAFADLLDTFSAAHSSRTADPLGDALLIEDGELTFFSLLWILRSAHARGLKPLEWVKDPSAPTKWLPSLDLDRDAMFASSWKEVDAFELLHSLGLAGPASIKEESERPVRATRRWLSFLSWLNETRNELIARMPERPALQRRHGAEGADETTVKTSIEERRPLRAALPVKRFQYEECHSRFVDALIDFFLSDGLRRFLVEAREAESKRYDSAAAFVKEQLQVTELLEALVSRTAEGGAGAGKPDLRDNVLLRLCRAPCLPLEYLFRAAQPYELHLLVIPFTFLKTTTGESDLRPASLAFATIAGGLSPQVKGAFRRARVEKTDAYENAAAVKARDWFSPYWYFLGSVASEIATARLTTVASSMGTFRKEMCRAIDEGQKVPHPNWPEQIERDWPWREECVQARDENSYKAIVLYDPPRPPRRILIEILKTILAEGEIQLVCIPPGEKSVRLPVAPGGLFLLALFDFVQSLGAEHDREVQLELTAVDSTMMTATLTWAMTSVHAFELAVLTRGESRGVTDAFRQLLVCDPRILLKSNWSRGKDVLEEWILRRTIATDGSKGEFVDFVVKPVFDRTSNRAGVAWRFFK